ncbi:MAG TPA: hypothetical protein VEG44_01765 [Candidatus Acidoferrales bacterium]|nr:hypothetical protein [Candidatus Acidoferrales bacterium]
MRKSCEKFLTNLYNEWGYFCSDQICDNDKILLQQIEDTHKAFLDAIKPAQKELDELYNDAITFDDLEKLNFVIHYAGELQNIMAEYNLICQRKAGEYLNKCVC